jgi:hypothetical protein
VLNDFYGIIIKERLSNGRDKIKVSGRYSGTRTNNNKHMICEAFKKNKQAEG